MSEEWEHEWTNEWEHFHPPLAEIILQDELTWNSWKTLVDNFGFYGDRCYKKSMSSNGLQKRPLLVKLFIIINKYTCSYYSKGWGKISRGTIHKLK